MKGVTEIISDDGSITYVMPAPRFERFLRTHRGLWSFAVRRRNVHISWSQSDGVRRWWVCLNTRLKVGSQKWVYDGKIDGRVGYSRSVWLILLWFGWDYRPLKK